MSSPDDQHWVMSGHDLIFEKIMMMVGLSSLESLHRCRQVCTKWNAMILQNIWESPSKRNIFKVRIKRTWSSSEIQHCITDIFPSDEDISHAKWLGKNKMGVESGC